MSKLLPLLTTLAQIARPWRPVAVVLIVILAAVLFSGPPAEAHRSSAGVAEMGLAQVGIEVSAVLHEDDGSVSNEAWQWQRSATEAGAYSDIPALEGGTSNPYTPSAGDLGMWLKAKVTYDDATGTGQTAESRPQLVLSQPALSNASFSYYNELGYVYSAGYTPLLTHSYAQGFTTGSDTSGYLLTAVRLALFADGDVVTGAWAVHADDAGKPAAAPLSAARPILNADIPVELFTFAEFTHPDGVQLGPDTKYWIVISQTALDRVDLIGIHAWSEWTGALEEGLATPPVDPGSEDGWSVDFTALTYYWDDPNVEGEPRRPELLPWQTFGNGLALRGRFVLRMALLVAPEATVQFAQESYTVAEGGTQSVTVMLSADPERTIEIPIMATNQGDAEDDDYSVVPSTVTFNAGETSKSFTFTAAQDEVDDDDESVRLGFGMMPDAWVSAGTPDETTVSITDDDDPFVEVEFAQDAYTAPEGGTVSVSVTLSANPERTVVIPLTTMNQGGAGSTDYSVPLSVTFNTGDMLKTITFSATHDTEDDDDESVLIAFGTLPSRVSAGTTAETTVSITDDDVPQVTVSFGQTAYTVAEGDTVTVTITLSADPERTVEIPLTATNQGSASSADYTVPTSVTFDADEMSKTITFTAADDSIDDDGESVLLAFGTLPTGVSLGTNAQATVSINDDDSAGVSVFEAALTIDEGGSGAYTIVLDSQPTADVTITINDPSDNTDVTAEPASLTFTSTDWNSPKTVTVNAAQDADADDETATVTHTVTSTDSSYSGASANSVSVTVTDDAPAGVTVAFGQAAYRVTEGGGVSVTVSLNEDPERTVVIPLVVTNQGGASDSDYSGVPESVTFNSGDTSTSFTLTAADDTLNETGESVKIAFGALPSTPIPVTAGAPDETTVTINGKSGQDTPTPPTVHFASPTYSVAEGNTVTVTVELSKAPGSDVVIPLTATEQGTAILADHSAVPLALTFAAADTQRTFTFEANQDMEDDDDESVLLGFSALPDGITATTGEASQATVTITDDDDPQVTVSFGQTAYTVPEGGTQAVTITLSADPERTVAIPLTTTDQGTATSADYTVPTSVTFDADEMSKTITFTAADDSIDDDGESVLLAFGTLPSGVTAGTPSEATVSITDDDSAGVSVSEAALTIDEGGSGAYTIVLDSQPTADVAITINDPSDNTDVTAEPASLTFTSTDWNSPKTVTVSAAQDADADDETATVTHTVTSTDSSYSGASANSVSVTVTDDAPAGVTVAFGQAAYRVTEGGGVSVTVTLNEDPERTVVILLVVTNQGGASDSDYSGVPESVTFNSGDTSTSFTLTAADDTLNEPGESVKIAFGALPSTPIPVTAGAPDETTVTINGKSGQDMPTPPTVHFASPTYSVAEGNTVTVTVELSKAPGSDLVISLTMTEQGEATFTDYSGVPIDVTFEAADTQKTFTFEANQDMEDDDDESVLLGFSALPDGITATTGEASQATVTITDDDDPQVTVMFGADSYTVPEGGTQAVTVTLSADPERTITIPLTATNQGSASSADYTVPSSVTFDADEMSKTITFTAADDSIDDDGESVLLAFGTLPTGVSEGAIAETTVSITDNDDPQVTVSFGQTAYTVPEGDTVTVTITLSADPERTVAIPLTATDQGTATSADYTVPTSVTFDADEMSKTITFTAADDSIDDDDESVLLAFGTLPTGVSEGAIAETTVSITDDDVPQVTVSFGQTAYTVAEGDTVTVTVTLSADPERAVEIPLTATNQGTATSADYTVPTSVTFDADEMSKTITFTAADDSIDDDDESVRLGFGMMPSGGDRGDADSRRPPSASPTTTCPFVDGVSSLRTAYTVPEGGTQ